LNKLQREYWSKKENRLIQAERVKNFFENHPNRKKQLSKLAKIQWDNNKLLEWRKEKTGAQWTPEFRLARKKAYARTYLQHSLAFAKKLVEQGKDILSSYNEIRANLPRRDNNIVKLETLLNKFFGGDKKQLLEAVQNFNHKIIRIEKLTQKIDVYDIEVENTHNFALASGIFVHNSAKQGRNREYQAILPLRGKVLNVERARLDKILGNNELKSLIIALGTNIGEQFDISKLRYHRIIIMTDADVDGAHIRTLLLTFFYRHFPELVTQGHIYIAQPPLYSVKTGKDIKYAYNDDEKELLLAELSKNKPAKVEEKKKKSEVEEGETANTTSAGDGEEPQSESVVIGGVKVNIQRYKGLGEMNPEQLWETTMNPEKRLMKQVTVEDAELANETFEILMGEDVEQRKKFIQTNAKSVSNLDI
jgi:DNA gyrase subunit B